MYYAAGGSTEALVTRGATSFWRSSSSHDPRIALEHLACSSRGARAHLILLAHTHLTHASGRRRPPRPPGSARVRSPLRRSVLPRVSPTLAAAEGHQSTGPSHPAWRVGRKVGKAPSSDESGSIEPGREVANVCSSGVPLAVVCSFERKGCGSRQGQQEPVTACGRAWAHKSSAVAMAAVAVAAVAVAVAQQWHVLMHMHH